MKAVETIGLVDAQGRLVVRERIPFPASSNVRVIVLAADDELDEGEWLAVASSADALGCLADAAEDVYAATDGKPFRDDEA